MSQHHHDLASPTHGGASMTATGTSASNSSYGSRPASSISTCGTASTPWDSLIEEEVLRDLRNRSTSAAEDAALAIRQRQRQHQQDLATRLLRQYLRESADDRDNSATRRLKRKTRTPHRIAKDSSSATTTSDPLLLTSHITDTPSSLDGGPGVTRLASPLSLSLSGSPHLPVSQPQPAPRLTSVVERLICRLKSESPVRNSALELKL